MGMDAEKDIQFITMPNQDARYPRVSMVLPVVDELLAALNSGFNPYVDQIRASDLQVLVRETAIAATPSLAGLCWMRPCPGPEAAALPPAADRPQRLRRSRKRNCRIRMGPRSCRRTAPRSFPDGSGTLPPDGSQELPPGWVPGRSDGPAL